MLGKTVEPVGRRRAGDPDDAGRRPGRGPALPTAHRARSRSRSRRGEVVGLTGLPGIGFEAVAQLVSGGAPAAAGALTTAPRRVDLARADVAACMRARRRDGAGAAGPRRSRRRAERPRQPRPPEHPPPGPAVARRRGGGRTRRPAVDPAARRSGPARRRSRQGAQRRQPAEGALRQVALRRARPARAARADPGGRRRRPRRPPASRRRDGRRRRSGSCWSAPSPPTSPRSATASSSSTRGGPLQELRTDDPDEVLERHLLRARADHGSTPMPDTRPRARPSGSASRPA